MISKRLFILLTCLFVVMIGFGITLPVLPFYVERLALAEGASRQSVVLHVGMLTGVYVLMQLIFAPVWGRWSDRIGRRRLILIGIAGLFPGASTLRSCHVAVVTLCGTHSRRHLVIVNAAGLGSLCCRYDGGTRARSRDGVARRGSKSRRGYRTCARRRAVAQRLAFQFPLGTLHD